MTLPAHAGRRVAVMGLGLSGLAAAAALLRSGAQVIAWDDDPRRRAQAGARGVPVGALEPRDFAGIETLVLSPGIALTHPAPHPVVARARAAGAAIIGDIDLLMQAERQAAFVGVTGTNGKSTTVSLIGHILAAHERPFAVGGNLGVPALDLPPLGPGGVYVLELSSFQLDLMRAPDFDIGVLLNVSPDHLDRHGGVDGYVAAKARLFDNGLAAQTVVIGRDDPYARAICDRLAALPGKRVVPISGGGVVAGGVGVRDGWLVDARERREARVLDLARAPALAGRHGAQNAAAAFAVAAALGLPAPLIAERIAGFKGLAHRLERVARIDGVLFVNDSKATNADATVKALSSFDGVYWIAGGRAKEPGFATVAAKADRIRHAFLIGEAAGAIAAALCGRVPITRCASLESAVRSAARQAVRDGAGNAVVLLSPACASYDQFRNFEARGAAFRAAVEALEGRRGDIAARGPRVLGAA